MRLTAAFAAATLLVLAGAGVFVYLRLRADFDDSINATLDARLDSATDLLAATGSLAGFPLEDPEEAFVQVLSRDAVVVDQVGQASDAALAGVALAQAATGTVTREVEVSGIDGTVRVIARRVDGSVDGSGDGGGRVVVVGQSLTNRDEALGDLLVSFLIGGPVAVIAASLAGYALARVGFAPVEAMRSSAADLSLTGDGRRLPVPPTGDEIQRLAITLNDMIGRLEQSLARERRFVADASHELRTPIAVIKTELEAAANLVGDRPDVAESLVAAIDECDSLAQLADDLLILSRSAEGGLPMTHEPTVVAELLGNVATRFADRAAGHGRSISVDANQAIVVLADPMRMRQALSNLVDNALRHGDGAVILRGRREGDLVQIEVTDEGTGFGADFAARAFDRFARGDAARTERGSGLGLAIVRTIAEAHGGTVCIVFDQTVTVRIELPVGDAAHQSEPAPFET